MSRKKEDLPKVCANCVSSKISFQFFFCERHKTEHLASETCKNWFPKRDKTYDYVCPNCYRVNCSCFED